MGPEPRCCIFKAIRTAYLPSYEEQRFYIMTNAFFIKRFPSLQDKLSKLALVKCLLPANCNSVSLLLSETELPQTVLLPSSQQWLVFKLKTPPRNHNPKPSLCLVPPVPSHSRVTVWGRGFPWQLSKAGWHKSCSHRSDKAIEQNCFAPLSLNIKHQP